MRIGAGVVAISGIEALRLNGSFRLQSFKRDSVSYCLAGLTMGRDIGRDIMG